MTQVKINNHTALSFEPLFVNDEAFKPVLTTIVKATFDISPNGQLKLAQKQRPICLEGEHWGEPEVSSYIYEPESAFFKPTTDIVIVGDAISTNGPKTHFTVNIRAGALSKSLMIIGDRFWQKQITGYTQSPIRPFERMPLNYENAFGGWDKRHSDESKHDFEPRNTVGKGFYSTKIDTDDPMPLPNIEDPNDLIRYISDRPAPVGCGFTLPHWQPRAGLAGTFDQEWQEQRSPLLPFDFNRHYFNAASAGLISPNRFIGNEPILISNMTPEGQLRFSLPGAKNPRCKISSTQGNVDLEALLDTVIINTNSMQLQLIWRNCTLLSKSAHEVSSIDVHYG